MKDWKAIGEGFKTFPDEGRSFAVGFSSDDKGYIGTGRNIAEDFFSNFYIFEPPQSPQDSGIWVPMNHEVKAHLFGRSEAESKGRWGAVSFRIDNYAYVGSGRARLPFQKSLNDFWRKDLSKDEEWEFVGFVGEDQHRRHKASTFAIGQKGYITLGLDTDNAELSDIWELNTADNNLIWTQKTPFPAQVQVSNTFGLDIGRANAAGFSDGGKRLYCRWNAFLLWLRLSTRNRI